VPAAAVIPAPAAYTNIAAVETFVVELWVLVCQVAGGSSGRRWGACPPPRRPRGSAGTQPLAVGPVPALRWSDQLLCEVPFSGDRNGPCTRHMLGRPQGCWPRAAHPPWSITGVYHRSHRGKLSVLKATRTGCMLLHGMSQYRLDAARELCWPWCPSQATWCCPPADPAWGPLGLRVGVVPPDRRWWQHLTPPRGLFRVQETATPEVKFLDRCQISSGEGVLQGHVH
jgi:hypothetical protein